MALRAAAPLGICLALPWSVTAAPVFERVTLTETSPEIIVTLLSIPSSSDAPQAVILTAGLLSSEAVDPTLVALMEQGYTLAGYRAEYPPDPDPDRRPVWIFWDARLAHAFALLASRAGADVARVIDWFETRPAIDADRVGWIGMSTSGIIGLSAMVHEPRIRAYLGFVATGAYRAWIDTWRPNGIWQGTETEIWPETVALLEDWDPVLHVDGLDGRPILLVCGEDDPYVDPDSTRVFVDAARAEYVSSPQGLRLVLYTATAHLLPEDVIGMYASTWFGRHLMSASPEISGLSLSMSDGDARFSQTHAATSSSMVPVASPMHVSAAP